ncbi:hypothetical protein SAMN05444920_127109 [Nonomuraea solani]|uniref:Uncharacterized protein n=1 Tax=Nonomuraea solani TaxID=1144553 RepID=A0A1H6EXG6_9ACTN|nr:hypothetical protein [Nonomuraea solani]SEH02570.1 hypothetical protein SAMN05444920_127109 [Nonomuraea solani]
MGGTDGGHDADDHSAGTHGAGHHIDFHHNDIGKAVGVEHHYTYPPPPGQIVEGDVPQCPPGFQRREQRLSGLLGDLAPASGQGQGWEKGETGDRHCGAVVSGALGGTPRGGQNHAGRLLRK